MRVLVLALLLLSALLPGTTFAYQTERVVLVIIDGLRYTEGLGDPNHTYVPEMAALADQGTVIEPFLNDGITYTSRAIPAIWCGAWTNVVSFSDPDCGGSNNNHAELPTVFEYFRKSSGSGAADCIYVLKALCPWKASYDVDYGPDYWPLYHSAGYSDLDVWAEAQTVIATQSPRFLLLYLADVDHGGHSGIWSEYTAAIPVADQIVGDLWRTLQAHPDYAGKTTMLVTNDHGRHTTDFQGHGDGCNGCRTIQLLAVGPDIRSGFTSTTPRTLPDITPTIGELLGFSTDEATGTAMNEIIVEPTGIGDDGIALNPQPPALRVTPNPLRGFARIRFTLPEQGPVRVSVYDLSGRPRAVVMDGTLGIGDHEVEWTARGPGGQRLGSGVYFLHVVSPVGTETRRVIVLN